MLVYIKDDFKNLLDFREWMDGRLSNLNNQGNEKRLSDFSKDEVEFTLRKYPSFYGRDTTFNEMNDGVKEFKKPELIDKILGQVKNSLSANVSNSVKSPKVKFNSMGLGVFSFDRAAMGLYRASEFFSPSQNRVPQHFEVEEFDAGHRMKADKTEVISRLEEKPDGSKKVRTNSRDVFAWFPKSNVEKNAVEIIMVAGGSASIAAEKMLFGGISAIIVAQFLEAMKIPVKIQIVLGSYDMRRRRYHGSLIPIKNYDEPLDSNLIALASSDPRYFRFDGFKGLIASYDEFNHVIPESYGSHASSEDLSEILKNSSYPKERLAPNTFFFGGVYSEADAIKQIQSTIAEIKERIQDQ